jgi:hypothetical protein
MVDSHTNKIELANRRFHNKKNIHVHNGVLFVRKIADYLHTASKRNSSEHFLFEFSMLIVCYLLVVCEYCGMPWRMLRICWEPFNAVLPACLFEYVDNASVAQWRRYNYTSTNAKMFRRLDLNTTFEFN